MSINTSYTTRTLFFSLLILFVATVVVGSIFVDSNAALAAEVGPDAVRERLVRGAQEGVGFDTPPTPAGFAGRLVRGALVLVGLIFLILIIYGGSLHLTAGGNEEQVKKSKTIIMRASIGLLVVIFAGAITQFLTSYLARPVATSGEADAQCPYGSEYESGFFSFGTCPDGYNWQISRNGAAVSGKCVCESN